MTNPSTLSPEQVSQAASGTAGGGEGGVYLRRRLLSFCARLLMQSG